MRTMRAPDSWGKSGSWNCVATVHGTKSPCGESPFESAALALPREMAPSSATCRTHRISGSALAVSSTGASSTNSLCAGASAMSCRSLGVFL
jgi:hypothetical protein